MLSAMIRINEEDITSICNDMKSQKFKKGELLLLAEEGKDGLDTIFSKKNRHYSTPVY